MFLENKLYQCNQTLYQKHLSISAETIFWAAALTLTWVYIIFVLLLLLLASFKDQSTSSVETRRVHPTEIETLSQLFWNCVTRVPLLFFIRTWVALFYKVCESVRDPRHLSRSPLCSLYKGTNALFWPSIINYKLPPPHSVLYWPSTQLHHLVTHSWANWI